MTYDDRKQELGRKPVQILELYLPRCQLTYGVSPCLAGGATPPPEDNELQYAVGTHLFEVPEGVTSIELEVQGGGGGGGGSCDDQILLNYHKAGGGGGGGGGYATKTISVSQGDVIEINVGSGGSGGAGVGPNASYGGDGTNGQHTWVKLNNVLVAQGNRGLGGEGGRVKSGGPLRGGYGGAGGGWTGDSGTDGTNGEDGQFLQTSGDWPGGGVRADGGEGAYVPDGPGDGGYGGMDRQPAGSTENDDGEDGYDGTAWIRYTQTFPPTPSEAGKCFNTYATCQDKDNFDPSDVAYRFATQRMDGLQVSGDFPTWPVITEVRTAPTVLDPGKGLGVRSSCSITLQDFPWQDIQTDPYLETRDYDPVSQGSFFGKLLARNPYYENARLVLHTGYLDDEGNYDAANFITREYFIDKINGPTASGRVTIEGKDILKFADSNRAQIPVQTEGSLRADINSTTSTVPVGSGQASLYSVDDWVRVDDEVMQVTAVDTGNDDLTVDRAVLPSFYPSDVMVAEAHDEDATVQLCVLFEDVRIDQIIYNVITQYTDIDSSFITFADWQATADTWFPDFIFSALITKSTGVKKVLEELCQHLVLLWWDERDRKVRFKALYPDELGTLPVYDDQAHIIDGSVQVRQDPGRRVSQTWVYFGQRNPVLKLDEEENYQGIRAVVDSEAESAFKYNQRKIHKVYSRWIPLGVPGIPLQIAGRLTNEYADTKTMLTVQLDPKDDDLWTGDRLAVATRYVQDIFGAAASKPYLVLQAQESISRHVPKYEYQLMSIGETGRIAFISPDEVSPGVDWPDYVDSTEAQRLYGYIADNDERFVNGDEAYIIA